MALQVSDMPAPGTPVWWNHPFDGVKHGNFIGLTAWEARTPGAFDRGNGDPYVQVHTASGVVHLCLSALIH